jgi:DNA-binding SARP family transcriptional activator
VAEIGPLSVAVNGGELIPVRGHVSIRALSLLILRGRRGAGIDELVDRCWPVEQPATARRSLANAIRRLRHVLGQDAVITSGSSYRIGDHVVSDRERFLAAMPAVRDALASGQHDRARSLADGALHLWRSEPWSDLDDVDQAVADRLVLQEAHRELLAIMATAAHRSNDLIASIAGWQDLVAIDPFREASWAELAKTTAEAMGRREGLRILQRARSALAEVGLEVSQQLLDLERRLASQAMTVGRSGTAASAAGSHRLSGLTDQSLPFVGRQRELEQLASVYRNVRDGRIGCAFLAGVPGSGKTRLALESLRSRSGLTVLTGRCVDGLDNPLGPFADILYRSDLELDETSIATRAKYEPAGLGHQESSSQSQRTSPDSVDEERRRDALTVAQRITDHARKGPLVLVIDDLHWASPMVLLILEILLTETRPTTLGVVGTYRTNPPDLVDDIEGRIVELAARPCAIHIDVGPLTVDEVAVLARHLGRTETAKELYSLTGGSAFFLTETLRGGQTVHPRRNLQTLIATRLTSLHPAAAHFLAAGAFLGLEFPTSPVADAVDLDAAEADQLIDDLHRAGFLVEANRVAGRSQFTHALVADAVTAGLGAREGQRLRLSLARSLERSGFPIVVWIESLLEAGPLVDNSTAVEAALAAAGRFSATHNDQGSIKILQLLLERDLPPTDAAPAQIELSRALMRNYRETEGRVLALRAADTATADGDGARLAEAALAYAAGGAWQNNSDRAGPELLRRALTMLDDDQTILRARVTARLSSWAIFTSSLAERDRTTAEALALARRSGSVEALADALNARQIAVSCPLTVEESLLLADELWSLERAGLARSELANRPTPATYWRGDGDRFRAELAEREADHNPAFRDPILHCLRAVTALHDGDLERARMERQVVLNDIRSDVETGNGTWLGVCIDWLAGDVTRSLEQVTTATEQLRGLPLRLTLAWLKAKAGDVEGAREIMDRVKPERLDTLPELFLGGFALGAAAMVAAQLRDHALGSRIYGILEPLGGQMTGVPWASYPSVSFFLGVLAHLDGDPDQADICFARANDTHQRMLAPSFVALTEAHWSWAIRSSDPDRANHLAHSATAFAESTGNAGTHPGRAEIGPLGPA